MSLVSFLFRSGRIAPARRWLSALVRAAIVLLGTAASLVAIAWAILYWGILPRIDAFRPQIEARLQAALGVPVTIERIEVRSAGLAPTVVLHEVRLRDAGGREALRLPEIEATLSVRSLPALEPRLERLRIERADLELRRDAEGRLFVAGIEVGGAGGADKPSFADWLFRQPEILVYASRLHWLDERRGAPPLELDGVDLAIRNGLQSHALRVDATPSQARAERLSLRGRFTQPLFAPAGDWRRWSGTLFADLPAVDFGELRRWMPMPVDLESGFGALRGWFEVAQGEARAATVDLSLAEVSVRWAAHTGAAPLRLARIAGRIETAREPRALALATSGFSFETADGLVWPAGALRLRLRQSAAADALPLARIFDLPIEGGEASADRLDLGLSAHLGDRLPVGAAVRRLLAETAPQGVAEGLRAEWAGTLDTPSSYAVRGRVEGLSIAAAPPQAKDEAGRPGWRGASVAFEATQQGGEARLAIDHGAIELPGIFEEPVVPVDTLEAGLRWRFAAVPAAAASAADAAPAVELHIEGLHFANADLQGRLDAFWQTGDAVAEGRRWPGRLKLAGQLQQVQATRVARYLPLGIGEVARRYVRYAMKGGTVRNTAFSLDGDLRDFPFHRGRRGEFRIGCELDDVTLAYAPPEVTGVDAEWPRFSRVGGALSFDRATMRIADAHAEVFGIALQGVEGRIDNVIDDATLEIGGRGRGPLADFLRYIQATPIARWTVHALDRAGAGGTAALDVAVTMPFTQVSRSEVRGSVSLDGNDLRIRPDTPLLGAARGRIDFTDRGFRLAGLRARIYGGDATLEGGSEAGADVRIAGRGIATAEGLRAAAETPLLARLATRMQGEAAWTAALVVNADSADLTVDSPLRGVSIDLPPPLAKAADAALPFHWRDGPSPAGTSVPAARPPALLKVEIGNDIRLQYLRDADGRVLQGGIAVRQPLFVPPRGVEARIALDRLDVDAWRGAALALLDDPSSTASASPAASASASAPTRAAKAASLAAAPLAASAEDYLPDRVSLVAGELRVGGRRLDDVTAQLEHPPGDAAWHATVTAEQLQGAGEFRPPLGAAPARLSARLGRLSLPPSEADGVASLLDEPGAELPALDIAVDDFELRGKRLGRLELVASNRAADASGGGAAWTIGRLRVVNPDAELEASGRWATGPNAGRTRLGFELKLADSGALLDRLGFGRLLSGGKGRLDGELSWNGSPMSFDVAALDGRMKLAVDSGRFLTVNPGAARLLGVLSLQSLPRRLSLDFRDLFGKGFAFDSVEGDVAIDRGTASTRNLRMRGVQAAVLMEGSADLAEETQDLHVVVVPQIDAGTASLAYAVINPAIGLGSFLAQLFLRKPLMQASTREFDISGSWDDPKVVRVPRTHDNDRLTPEAAASANATSN